MNLDARPEREDPKYRRIQTLADEAESLAKGLDLDRYPSAHISRALRGIQEDRERERLFGQIRAELKRRGFKSLQDKARDQTRMLEEGRRQILIEDAFKHEAQIDPRERDDDEHAA